MRFTCLQERPAAGVWFWCLSFRMVIASDSTWQSTPEGQSIIFAKAQFDSLAPPGFGDWASWMQKGVQMKEPQLRAYFQ